MLTLENQFQSMSKKQLEERRIRIVKGCGKKVDFNGDCYYISSRGTLRLCSTCARHLRIATEVLEEKNANKN